jgi:hypothetical protein
MSQCCRWLDLKVKHNTVGCAQISLRYRYYGTGTRETSKQNLQILYRYITPPVLRIRDVLSRIPDPDPTIAPSWIRGVKKHRIPDPTSFFIKAINKFCLIIPDPGSGSDHCSIPHPGSGSRIRGGKKAAPLFQSNQAV